MLLAPSEMVQDCVESLSGEAVLRMVHTHDGCRVGCMVAAYSTPKQRKKIVKATKGHVMKMCADEFAYVMLIKLLAAVDDTELSRKTIVAEIQVQNTYPALPHGLSAAAVVVRMSACACEFLSTPVECRHMSVLLSLKNTRLYNRIRRSPYITGAVSVL